MFSNLWDHRPSHQKTVALGLILQLSRSIRAIIPPIKRACAHLWRSDFKGKLGFQFILRLLADAHTWKLFFNLLFQWVMEVELSVDPSPAARIAVVATSWVVRIASAGDDGILTREFTAKSRVVLGG